MTIEIHEPELEELIQQRLESGHFKSVEDFLLQALKSAAAAPQTNDLDHKKNFADFLLESPLPGSELKLERIRDYPRSAEL
jgi:hypothetical protein